MTQNRAPHSHDLLLVGGGAAALGLLCAMIRTGQARDASILMLDDAPARCGRPGAYARSYAVPVRMLRQCLDGLPASVTSDPALCAMLDAMGEDGARVPRPQVEACLSRLKRLVLDHLRRDQALILRAARADTIRFEDGLWQVDNQPGSASRRLVLACGAAEEKTRILAALLDAGMEPERLDRVVRSTDALGADRDAVLAKLASADRALIVGRTRRHSGSVRDQLRDWAGRTVGMAEPVRIEDCDSDALNAADLVITALGETPRLPRTLLEGQLVKFGGTYVDAAHGLLDHSGMPLPAAHAVGPALRPGSDDAGTDRSRRELEGWFGRDGEAVACGSAEADRLQRVA